MLTVTVLGTEMFDETSERVVTVGDVVLELEHSLVALSKWESKHGKPFLGKQEKTTEEVLDYIRCMTLTPEVPEEIFSKLSHTNLEEINAYIEHRMTATWFSDAPGAPPSRVVITAEIIYYWMITFGIPFECQYWHLNRLFTLIRVCEIKTATPKKMSRREAASRQRDLNAQRRAQLGTTG